MCEREENAQFSLISYSKERRFRVYQTLPDSWKNKKQLQVLTWFLKLVYYRDYSGEIWRNSKIHDCQPILENYRHWLLPGNHVTYNLLLVCESWLPCRLTDGFLTFELLSSGFCVSFAATPCTRVPPTALTAKRQITKLNSNHKRYINSHGTRIGSQLTYGKTRNPPPFPG